MTTGPQLKMFAAYFFVAQDIWVWLSQIREPDISLKRSFPLITTVSFLPFPTADILFIYLLFDFIQHILSRTCISVVHTVYGLKK